MKKVIVGLISFCVMVVVVGLGYAGSAANSHSVGGNSSWGIPNNVTIYALDSANYKTDDTIGATYKNYYGPYMLSAGPSRPQFKGFRCLSAKSAIGATCTLSVEYQILGGKSLADTGNTGWTSFDSVKAGAGNAKTYVDISSLPGASIAFKLHALDNGSNVVIAKPLKIVMFGTSTESVDTKH